MKITRFQFRSEIYLMQEIIHLFCLKPLKLLRIMSTLNKANLLEMACKSRHRIARTSPYHLGSTKFDKAHSLINYTCTV